MKFDNLINEVLQQLELDFRNIPAWAKELGDVWDTVFKQRYYPIKNMSKGKQRDAAFKKFWLKVVSTLGGKGVSERKMIDLGVPEYIFNLHR